MAKLDLDRDRIEKLVREAVHDSDQEHDKEFENSFDSFEKWLYYTIAIETTKLRNQILLEHIDELRKLMLRRV